MSGNLHEIMLSHNSPIPGTNVYSKNEVLRELLSLPDIANTLLSELMVVPLTVSNVVHEQGDRIEYVYFPLDSVISGMAITEDGTAIETSMIGRDGLTGISTLLNSEVCQHWSWVTISGSAVQLEAKLLGRLLVHNERALKSLLKCYRSLITQLSQRCCCNTRHTIMERLCCWLLMIHDRLGADDLKLTQEMIASRIGARRAGITVAAGILQQMSAIDYRRGNLHIRNRTILQQVVCECYDHMASFALNNPSANANDSHQVTISG